VLEVVSKRVIKPFGYVVVVPGFDLGDKVKVTQSVPAVTAKKDTVTKAPVDVSGENVEVLFSSNAVPDVPAVSVRLVAGTTACEGTEDKTPIPSAATATSAIRLKFVVVDIYFLSLVATRNFLVAASR